MSDEKIIISLEDVNSEQVDAEVKRQEIAIRMAAHQATVQSTTSDAKRMNPSGLFRRSIVYMAVFGLAASLIGWGLGEIAQYKSDNNPLSFFMQIRAAYIKLNPQATTWQFKSKCKELRNENPKFANNPYFCEVYLDAAEWKRAQIRQKDVSAIKVWNQLWYVLIAMVVSLGLAIAEPVVSQNRRAVIVNGVLGVALGCLGGYIVSLFVDVIYRFLGGGQDDSGFVQQMFARGVGWSILGLFVAIAPGLVMRSWKKFGLGLAGGAIGGLLGGILFDLICSLTGSDIPARCFNIIGLGLGAAVATALLENLAKQGWLRVATGVITGKQFILYRNPTIIGSSPRSEIYLFKDPSVAAKHAAINGIGGKFILTALGGATVVINGQAVSQQVLKNGDQIRIGNTIFLFEARVIKKVAK